MRLRGLLAAVVVLAALSVAVYWSNKAQKAEEKKAAVDTSPKVLSVPEDQFQQIELHKTGSDDIVLKKGQDGKWIMFAPKTWPLDQDAVSGLISTLSSLSASRLVEEKTADLAQFGLSNPSLVVTITKKDGKTEKLLVGDESPASGGYFAKREGDPRIFIIASYNKTGFDKSLSDLRDKRLLTFDPDKLSRVQLIAKGQQMEFGKNNQNEWQIIKPTPLRADGGRIEDLVRRLKDAKMDVATSEEASKKAASAFAKAPRIALVKVTDNSGTQELEVRKDKENNYYAKSSVVEGVHKVSSDLGEAVDKSLVDFRNKKLFDFGWNDPNKIEIRDGSKQVVYVRSGEKWTAGATQLDASSVQAIVDKLRDLTATEFVEKGFGSPVFEVTVTSNDGKRVEKVLISKQGEKCFAKRENESTIYQLEGKALEELQKAVADVKTFQPPKGQKK